MRRALHIPLAGQEFAELEWKCFPGNHETTKGEFLVDFLWWRARQGAVLVVESEWSQRWEHILDDFGKIAVIKAPFKLMIYSSYPRRTTSDELKAKFEDHLNSYQQHIKGETYIFLEFMPKEFAQAFVWQAKASGPAEAVVLEPLVTKRTVARPRQFG